jgi:uncharacterized LabA/DUF88 family protein
MKVGVYVDVENIKRTGGFGMRFDILRKFACREGGQLIRMNAYAAIDRGRQDSKYQSGVHSFFSKIRSFGFKVLEKEVRWFQDEDGNKYPKANADLDMAVDTLLQSKKLDRVVLVTGDGDFCQVIRALQNNGCRVEVVGFNSVSMALQQEADFFLSGYLVPELLPTRATKQGWGEIGSRVRGTCSYYRPSNGNSYGFMRFLTTVEAPLWDTNTRGEDGCPYSTAYFSGDALKTDFDVSFLPSYRHFFEFTLLPSQRQPGQFQAGDIDLVGSL